MPCHAAMLEKSVVISPDITVENAVKELQKKKQSVAAVVDDTGILIGFFSIPLALQNLLPVSVAMNDGVHIDIPIKAAPGIAKRLRKVYPLKVSEIMERKKINTVQPETPIWECVSRLLSFGSPVFVTENSEGKFLGTIDDQSILRELQRLLESEK